MYMQNTNRKRKKKGERETYFYKKSLFLQITHIKNCSLIL